MINVSNEYKLSIKEDRKFICYCKIILADGTELEFNNENIVESGFCFEDGVSGSGSFDIGAAIINQFTLILDNMDDQLSRYDFTGAVLYPKIGLQLSDTLESFSKGIYTVDEATYQEAVITIKALDNMHKFERAWESNLGFPATLDEIVREACEKCEVLLNTTTFDNSSYSVLELPEEGMTCREVISYAAQIAGCWARINRNGSLDLSWYDRSALEYGDSLDGGNFTDYNSGDTADGGNFDDYTSGDSIDAGEGFEEMAKYHHIWRVQSQTISVDDVNITGIRVTEKPIEDTSEDEDEEEVSYLCGFEGYILAISDNPFIQKGQAKKVAEYLGLKIIGMRFRPLTVSAHSDPSIEAGDAAYVSDRKGNSHGCYITNSSFSAGGWQTISCDAESASRNSAEGFSALTKLWQDAQTAIKKEKALREQMQEDLANRLENASGLFRTYEKQPDGSEIIYLHDKTSLDESMTIIKITSAAVGVSTDGGTTFPYGFTVDGNMIANILSVIGIDANWIRANSITAEKLDVGYRTSVDVAVADAQANAEKYTDSSLTSYYTKVQIDNTLSVTEAGILASAKATATEYTDDKLKSYYTQAQVDVKVNQVLISAEEAAEAYTDNKLTSYYTKAQIDVKTDSIESSVTQEKDRATSAEDVLSSKITQTAESITAEVTRATAAEDTLSSKITQTADSLTSEITRATTAESTLSSRITQTESQISFKVSMGDVSSQLSVESGGINLTGNRISITSDYFKLTGDGVLTCTGANINGTLTTAVTTHSASLTGGRLQGYYGGNLAGYFDTYAHFNGVRASAIGGYNGIMLVSPNISVYDGWLSPGNNFSSAQGGTGSINVTYNLSISANSSGGVSWSYYHRTLQFINGLMVSSW